MIAILNANWMNPASNEQGIRNIYLSDGKVAAITKPGEAAPDMEVEQTIDASGMIAAPGLMDVHVHFRDPGFTYKEDICSGAKAAAAGGFTTVVLMANTNPAVDTPEVLKDIVTRGAETGIHVLTCANITKGMQGDELADLSLLKEAGAVGFTDDGKPLMHVEVVKEAMAQAGRLGLPLSFHEEDPAFISENGVNPGAAKKLGLKGSPRDAEITMVKRDLELALQYDADVSIQHISSEEAVELVRQAKQKSKHVFAEVTPHHFTLTEDAVQLHGTLAKMNPPLREERDRMALIRGLQDGTIDMIATDHAPHAKEEKDRPFAQAPSGILGLETALGLGIRELVQTGYLSMMELLYKMTKAPADLYRVDAGYLEVGGPADLILFNPDETRVVEKFASKSQNSPFIGEELPGVIHYTICAGKIVYEK